MTDVVVTVPQAMWKQWIEEGDLPGEPWSGLESHFNLSGAAKPDIQIGERVYVVALGKLRGYAPLRRLDTGQTWTGDHFVPHGFSLVRRGGAVAVTIPNQIRGFPGWRYRWWERKHEAPFPEWMTP